MWAYCTDDLCTCDEPEYNLDTIINQVLNPCTECDENYNPVSHCTKDLPDGMRQRDRSGALKGGLSGGVIILMLAGVVYCGIQNRVHISDCGTWVLLFVLQFCNCNLYWYCLDSDVIGSICEKKTLAFSDLCFIQFNWLFFTLSMINLFNLKKIQNNLTHKRRCLMSTNFSKVNDKTLR